VRGKSDLIDALAVARAALREPLLDSPRPQEARLRELKLLVDHRDDLVDERRRCQQRLRWHLHELDPALRVPLGALDRSVWLDRLARRLARREQTIQVRIARELLARCRSLTRSVLELDRELHAETTAIAPQLLELPGCGGLTAAKLLCEIGPVDRFRSDAQLARHAGVAPLEASSGKHRRHRLDRGGTANSTAPSTASPSPKAASTQQHAPTSNANKPKAKPAEKHSAASNDNSPAPSTPPSKTSPY